MKAASHKSETKKRKRDDSQESICESPKKAKVHAQRKFAQGAAVNSPVITPIKDKVRPTPSVPNPAPMLTNKRPNTEDFLTFLCFRRTSILPPKLDFFKDALLSEPEASTPSPKSNASNHKFNSEQPKQNSKKSEKNEESKKSSHGTGVQALRKKYKEQRLAKQKVTNVTKLAQKVKGKNMMRTRSSTIVEETKVEEKKTVVEEKEKGSVSGLRSGLKRLQPTSKKLTKKLMKPKNIRTGLRSAGPTDKSVEKSVAIVKPANVKKIEKDTKKTKVSEDSEVKGKQVKMKKAEGFSDFSSDDNEPLAGKKPKIEPRRLAKKSVKNLVVKRFVKTRSKVMEPEVTPASTRPTRKTKEAAAIYMEMITKKLVSPEKSGDDDASSVDSFPELPNIRRNGQSEILAKTKPPLHKKGELKPKSGENVKGTKKLITRKLDLVSKTESKLQKDDSDKKASLNEKKEGKNTRRQEDASPGQKKLNKVSTKEDVLRTKLKEEEKKEKEKEQVQTLRPTTRSRHQESELELKNLVRRRWGRKLKTKPAKLVNNPKEEKFISQGIKKYKRNKQILAFKEKRNDSEKKKEFENEKKKEHETERKRENENERKKENENEKKKEKENEKKKESESEKKKINESEKKKVNESEKKKENENDKKKESESEKKKEKENDKKKEKENDKKKDSESEKKKVNESEKKPENDCDKKRENKKEECAKALESNKHNKNEPNKPGRKSFEKGKSKLIEKEETKEKQENERVSTPKKLKKSVGLKLPEKNSKTKKTKSEKKIRKNAIETTEPDISSNKRPTRKCSTADKIWIDIDGFTSDEDDFMEMTTVKSRATNLTEKQKSKPEAEKKGHKTETKGSYKKEKTEKKESEKEIKTGVQKESKKEISVLEKPKSEQKDKKEDKKEVKHEKKESKVQEKKEIKEVDKNKINEVEENVAKEITKKEVKEVDKKETKTEKKESKSEKKELKIGKKDLKTGEKTETEVTSKSEVKEPKKEMKTSEKKKEIKSEKKLEVNKPGVESKLKLEEEDAKAMKNVKSEPHIKLTEKTEGKPLKTEDIKKDEKIPEKLEDIVKSKGNQPEKKTKENTDVKNSEFLTKEIKHSDQDASKSSIFKESKQVAISKETLEPISKKIMVAESTSKKTTPMESTNRKFSTAEVTLKNISPKLDENKETPEEEVRGKPENLNIETSESLKKGPKKGFKKSKRKSDSPRSLREREALNKEANAMEDSKSYKRTRPVRSCSTGKKKWIESDSDSFNFYDTSEDEDNIPIVDFSSKNKLKSSLGKTDAKEKVTSGDKKVKKSIEKEKKFDENCSDNFSESDEEPLKKKAHISEMPAKKPESKSTGNVESLEAVKLPIKTHRDVPGLNPLKKNSTEVFPVRMTEIKTIPTVYNTCKPDTLPLQTINTTLPSEPKIASYETKNFEWKSEVSGVRKSEEEILDSRGSFVTERKSNPITSSPNRIEMILNTLKRDKVSDPNIYSKDVQVNFGNISYQPVAHTSQINPFPYSLSFPPPQREPISTHGLDLLSEVALPQTPMEKISSQTERIEKWLKDSVAVEHKNTFSSYEDSEYKNQTQKRIVSQPVLDKSLPEPGYFYGKPIVVSSPNPSHLSNPISVPVSISSHSEAPKFGHIELMESQKLLKRNVFAPEIKQQDVSKSDHPPGPVLVPPKKTLTSVQDLLKLQKERKDVVKSSAGNSPHLKNCKCNSCVVKKGWFKNKPVPKNDQNKPQTMDGVDDSTKPFQSLTKAFNKTSGETKSSRLSVSVAPIIVPPPTSSLLPPSNVPLPSTSKEDTEKKLTAPQRKLSFLERMKERERKEAAAALKLNQNAFSPNNESSVYAFEPEPDQVTNKINASFRNKARDSRTPSTNTSKSDEDALKICEDESSTNVSLDKFSSETKVSPKVSQSASIAVQVNLDTETVTQVETLTEIQDGKSIEISTQTEVAEEDSDSPMFYIPLQQARTGGAVGSSDQHLIQGVALKLGTEGPMGPNQRVIMKAKLVTKPPDAPSIKAVVMPQPKRMFDQKINNPPIGTVQPTTRKPPEISSDEPDDKSIDSNTLSSPIPLNKSDTSTDPVSQTSVDSGIDSDTLGSKSQNSPATVSSKPSKTKSSQGSGKEKPEISEEHSPSSSASSSKARRTSKKNSETVINPSNITTCGTASKLVEAPTFHPTEKEFQDPFEFFDRIRPAAEKFGLCRIVPPSNFKPDCKVSDDMRFTAYNQYVHRMFHRWGPNIKEMMAIKKYLATQSISLKQPPWIGGIEVDLPRLYQSVQNCGGLMKVMEKKKWHHVADMMKIPKAAQDRVTKLDDIYCKYLLPYDTLSHDERQKLFDEVEKDWIERQNTPLESQDSQGDEDTEEESYIEECEECVVKGKNMALNQFYRIARNSMTMWFKNSEPPPREVETEFWKHVSERNHHVCVHSGSIDSSGWGYGFPIAKNNSFSKHPWNLKVLTNNSGSVLRSLGPVMGVTVPTIHVGMVFTAFCWYRDPHGLPWIEYLHTGAPKIWYGISDDNSSIFHEALTKLLPRYIKDKRIWLPSDTAMIPPGLLVEHGVSLCHTVQEPGQFILVFPRAFTSSICTGYLVSESVYFAQPSWLTTAEQVFKDIQESCEPTMFSLEKLLFSIATDSRSSVEVLKQVLPMVWHIRQKEIDERKTLFNLGLKTSERLPPKEAGTKKRRGRWAQEDDGDYECEVCRMNLYVSLVTNSQEEGVYCLPHAIELLTQKRNHLKYCKLMYNYTQEEMNELVEKLEQKIESKAQKKLQNKSSTTTK